MPDVPANPTPSGPPASGPRCAWPGEEPRYIAYHDEEWGVPEHDARALWEKLVLDGFQAGLSWWVILKKREDFRRAFAGFDPSVVAEFGAADVERLVVDASILRSRSKIQAAINGARAWLEIEATHPGGFHDFLWRYVDGRPQQNAFATMADVPTRTTASEAMARDLKRAGFSYCGPVICYAFMQAVGIVNDHLTTCFRHAECAACAESAG